MQKDTKLIASSFTDLKAKVKAEMQRRKYTGSVASYGDTTYDYSTVPTKDGKVLEEHITKIKEPLDAVNPNANHVESTTIVEELSTADAYVTYLKSASLTTSSSGTGCMASCTGLCSTTCSGTCGGGCSGSCSGGCSGCSGCGGACSSSCSGGCSGGCSGSCSGCTGSCTSACTGCTGNCAGNCEGSCSDGCYHGCSTSCFLSCSGTCTSCSGTCTGSCKTTSTAAAISTNSSKATSLS